MDIAAIIVNYRTADATVESVTALLQELQVFDDPRIVVVDNDSQDGSAARLRESFAASPVSRSVTVIESGHNGGYGFGINVGVRHLLALPVVPRYVYVINPDAVAGPGAVRRLVSFMEVHPEAGLAGSAIQNPTGEIQVTAFRFPSILGELESTAAFRPLSQLLQKHIVALTPSEVAAEFSEVDWVSGTSMLFRREVFTTAGFFDEGFFLYFEEIDFARRVHLAGWKVYFVAGAPISHVGSLATGMDDETRAMPRYWFQARRRYLVKHHGRLYGAGCDAAWLCGNVLNIAKAKVLKRPLTRRPGLLRDFLRYSVGNILKPAPSAEQNRFVDDVGYAPGAAVKKIGA